MALSGGSRFGGMGGGMGTLWNQQRSLRYLREGKPDVSRTLVQVWESLRVYRWQLVLGTLVMILGAGVGLIPPLLIRELIDTAIPQHHSGLFFCSEAVLSSFPSGAPCLGWVRTTSVLSLLRE